MKRSEMQDIADRLAGYCDDGWEILDAKSTCLVDECGDPIGETKIWELKIKKIIATKQEAEDEDNQ